MDGDGTSLTEQFSLSLFQRTENTTESLQIFDVLVKIKNWKTPTHPTGTEVRNVTDLGHLLSQEPGLN